ncbi:MAG TPA: aldo/keto reductase [Candidatus Binatia bacterium]|nr:aldo/keto reductase [Candidatus Binatia bacterium]
MDYRQLGNSGVRVSVIGLGANRFGSDNVPQTEVNRIIDAALDLGVNFIDTSNNYTTGRSEESLGHALQGRGDKVVLATKFSFPKKDGPNTWGASRYQMMQAVEGSLRRLQMDHIDLYYAHRWDDTTPIEKTLRAFDDLIRLGKVCYIGASAYASWQLAHANVLAQLRGWTPFVVLQSEYNLLDRSVEREVLPYCRAHRVGFVPYHPLAGGFLTGKYEKGKSPPPGFTGRERELRPAMHDRSQLQPCQESFDMGRSSRPKDKRVGSGMVASAAAGLFGDYGSHESGTCLEQCRWGQLAS